jgi:hypothetical protein|tara:strand:+ start:8942 stop:10462 length:1521 start_codon:yes stop_codon:yes gene_type:complete
MAIINYTTLEYTEEGGGAIINFAYHDSVFAMHGLSIYQVQYPNITNFKYKLQVRSGSQSVATLEVPPNEKGYGLFNIRALVEDLVVTDESGYDILAKGVQGASSTMNTISFTDKPHAVHQIDKFCRNRDNLKQIHFVTQISFFSNGTFYESYTKSPKVKFGQKISLLPFYFYWNSCLHFQTQQSGQLDFSNYILNSNSSRFLTNKRTNCVRNVTKDDYETLGFLNGKWQVNYGYGNVVVFAESDVKEIKVVADGTNAFTLTIPNTSANGGSALPIFQQTTPSAQFPATEDEGLLYVGIGPMNMINSNLVTDAGSNITEQTFDGITSYEIYSVRSSGAKSSETIRYDVIPANCKYERIRLAYLNRLGAYDYINLTKKSTEATEITRSNYKASYGYLPLQVNQTNTLNKWEYGSYEGGTRSYNTNAITTFEANSDWLNDADAEALKELFTSPVAYIQRPNLQGTGQLGKFEAVVCTEKDYVLQTTDNDKLKQYVITIQVGQEQRVQRL